MKITLQRKIAILWFTLSILNAVNYVYQTIRLQGTFGSFNNSVFTTPYFAQILSYELYEMFIPISDGNVYFFYQCEWYLSIFLTLLSIIIPITLFFYLRYSRTIAKVFLVLFVLLSIFTIFINLTFFITVRNEFSTSEITFNKYLRYRICYYSVISFIALLMFIGLFFCKTKKEEKIETTSI